MRHPINRYVLLISSVVFNFCHVSRASDSTEINLEEHPLTVASDSLLIPSYECYPVTRNYVFNIAISNNRLTELTEETVSFKWKDYADNNR